MKNIGYILLFIGTIVNAQSKDSDSERFYRGDEKYLKPIKYVLFDENKNDKKEEGDFIYFYINNQTFFFNSKKHKIDTCSFDFFNKIKLENPTDLIENEWEYFKRKVREYKRNSAIKAMPLSNVHKYFKVSILEKTNDNKVLK
jgi:hypothetical protein